ncbi:lysophospholipid acyltransferase family protein [Tenacibaculum sp. SG-28]|uniref:lysophospholipid acyltransferase family protein n=1 Tax=Tenacibaculum sp. SG-28 TaxID=754426 RepID=UPI000CF53375|nr:lysophospholipid acyltransferase family protein [Tenacibaculum sp. SG-28]PQJ23326.1 lipid A biosynthesis acyltransferase [Tenacibaculum sp. SG-28]
MHFISYYLVFPLVWLISRLPMKILYLISDLLFLIVYYGIGYRKKTVLSNLKLAFPEKEDREIKKIAKEFFKHFTDLLIESVKTFSISEKEILKRYQYKNPEVVNALAEKGRSIVLVGAHQANWEWSFNLSFVLNIDVYGAYTKLQNPYFENKIKQVRTKFGVKGVKTSETVKKIHTNHQNNKQALYLLLSDQSPMLHKTHYWSEFMGVNVPIHTGAEMLAKKYDFSVVNYTTKKIKRGYYETEFTLLCEEPKEIENYDITDQYLAITERAIREQPSFYLWSHKRFKHANKYREWLEKNSKKNSKKKPR